MGNQFFHIGEEKAENGVDVADAFRRLAEELRGNPNGQEARQKALTLLRRKDINGVLGETRVEWLKKDISQLQDTESIQTFLVNSSRYMEKEGIAKLSWENLSKYLGQLDKPEESNSGDADGWSNAGHGGIWHKRAKDMEAEIEATAFGGKHGFRWTLKRAGHEVADGRAATLELAQAAADERLPQTQHAEGDFSKASSPIINDPKDKRKQSELAKDMPDSVKLKDSRPQDIESHWTEMDDRQRTRVAKEAGFNEVESRELAKLAWEGLDPSIKKDLSWVLNADPEHLPGKDDVGDVGESDNTDAEAQEDLDNVIRKEMDDVVRSFAEARASESWSTATDGMREDYGDGVHVTAEFGEWLAVNGALIMPGKDIPQPPAGFKKTKFGGAIPDFEVEVQMENVKDFLARELKFPLEMVERVAQQQKFGTSVMVKVSGVSEVFALKDNPVLTEDSHAEAAPVDKEALEKAIQKAMETLVGEETEHPLHRRPSHDDDKSVYVTLSKVDAVGQTNALDVAGDSVYVLVEPDVYFSVKPDPDRVSPDFDWTESIQEVVAEEWSPKFEAVVRPVLKSFFPKMKSEPTVGLGFFSGARIKKGHVSIEFEAFLPVENESVEDMQKDGWSQDRVDSVWHKKVGTKSGAAFPAHMDAYGKFFWSVYDGSKLVARGEERTDKEAMQAADEHLVLEPVPVGEATHGEAATLHDQLATAAKKAVPEADPFDIEAAIYWFASANYQGMGDPLYGVLSLSKFKPGPTHRSVEDEGETATDIYNYLKTAFSKREADEPNVTVRPMTLDPKTKRQANAFLSELSKKYWPSVPLFDIAEELKKYGLAFEDSIVTGAQGRDTFELSKGGMPIKNSMLAISWFKMPVSGKYEITAYLSE